MAVISDRKTQLQVSEKINQITWREKGLTKGNPRNVANLLVTWEYYICDKCTFSTVKRLILNSSGRNKKCYKVRLNTFQKTVSDIRTIQGAIIFSDKVWPGSNHLLYNL